VATGAGRLPSLEAHRAEIHVLAKAKFRQLRAETAGGQLSELDAERLDRLLGWIVGTSPSKRTGREQGDQT